MTCLFLVLTRMLTAVIPISFLGNLSSSNAIVAGIFNLFSENLMKYSSNQEDCETATIYWAMGECFTRFSDIVSKNSAKTTTEDPNVDTQEDIYDDCGSKLEAWRSASFLVGLLLRCDMEIVALEAKTITSSQGLTVGFL